MAMMGAFPGGAGEVLVPAGYALVHLQVNTVDRLNLDTASFTITADGFSETYNAAEDGRVSVFLPTENTTYNVHLNHQGEYSNDDDQTLNVESKGIHWVYFDLFDYPSVSTVVKVFTVNGSTVTATNGTVTVTAPVGSDNWATIHGLTVDTWTISDGVFSETIFLDELYTEIYMSYVIYGVRVAISTSSPTERCVYTDYNENYTPASGTSLNSWAGHSLIEDIRPCVINNGVKTYLDRNDLTLTADGAPSGIDEIGKDAFTEFPMKYLSITSDDSYIYIKFSEYQVDDTYQAYAHLYNSVVQDAFYWACFLATVSDSLLYSVSGVTPTVSTSITDFIAYAQGRGTGYDIIKWHQLVYIQALFILLYRSTNSQEALGMGYVGGSSVTTVGPTSFSDNNYGMAGSTDSTEHMAFFWLTDLWGNAFQFLGCAMTNSNRQLLTILGGDSSITQSDFTNRETSSRSTNLSGYISRVAGGALTGFFPTTASGSSSTYWCDYGVVYASCFPRVGGYYSSGDYAGVFCAYFSYSATNTSTYCGSRLSLSVGVAEASS